MAARAYDVRGRAGGPAVDFASTSNTVGAPSLRLQGRESELPAQRASLMLPVREMKFPSSLHSLAPIRLRPTDKNDNCSSAIAPEFAQPIH